MAPPLIPDDLAERLDPVEAPMPDYAELGALRDAAVLALLVPRNDVREREPGLLLIERTKDLRAHAGQLAFPGGKAETYDESLVATALREAHEEVALPPGEVEVLGRLGTVPTPTGFRVAPFVAWAPRNWTPQPCRREVARILEVPLSRLVEPGVHSVRDRGHWRGLQYVIHEFAIGDPPLWGATGRMVWDLLERMEWVKPLP